ncbi:hypothetical protein [Streptomyces sulphureus]|uniref:hypothetical protein n=1 Tax=Streptomyces sulphureus TaxID=47758 RepID=UPI000376BBBC|nr:hypothetical protein [Streptomyces sulphureus]
MLHVPPAPAPALRSVETALGSPTAVHDPRTAPTLHAGSALRAAAGQLRPQLPLPVHEMTGIRRTADAPYTRLTGWRFHLHDSGTEGGEPVGAAEAVLTADGWAFAHFCEGPYVTSSVRALREAHTLPGGHQPRLLSVPELYMLTLWLCEDLDADPAEGSPSDADLLIPLAPAPPGIAAHQPQRADALLALLTHRLVTAPLSRPMTGTGDLASAN